ncbi:MAG: phospholipid carrier-dependent glycosyltransferase [Chloroflexi bacterium]|nr:phospholipid carrier-dependent glycosyltransferase [Chloroflexota bacterium]
MKTRISTSVLLFLFFFFVYATTMTGQISFGDEAERFLTAQSLVERHDLAIQFDQTLHQHIGLDGRNYSFYELGSTLPLAPFYAVGATIANFFPFEDPLWVPLLFTGLFNPIVTALTGAMLYPLALALGNTRRAAVVTALLFGLSTIALPYSRALEREPILALFLVLSIYTSIRFRQTHETKWLWLAGTTLGYLFFAKIANVIVFPLFAFYIMADFIPVNKTPIVKSLFRLAAWAIPIGVLVGTQAWYNYIRYGNFADIGLIGETWGNPVNFFNLSNLPTVLSSVLFSPVKSIFIYSPPLLLFIPGIFTLAKTHRSAAWLIASVAGTIFLFYSLYSDGGGWWGPKYLVAITPLAVLPLGSLLTRFVGLEKRFWYSLAFATGLGGFFVQIIAVLIGNREYADIEAKAIDLAGAFDFFRHGAINSLVFYLSPTSQLVQVNTYAIVTTISAVILFAWIISQIRHNENAARASIQGGLVVLALGFLVQATALVIWVIAPYPQVLTAKVTTNFVSGNLFRADQRYCEATLMYIAALNRDMPYADQAVAQIDQLLPRTHGRSITLDNLTQLETTGDVAVSIDSENTLSKEGALKLNVRDKNNSAATAVSDFMRVQGNSTYELSGWIKSTAISKDGSAFVNVYEDDGKWGNRRSGDILTTNGSSSWRPFWSKIKTLSSARRIVIKVGLGTQGTVSIDRLQLAEITTDNPESKTPQPCQTRLY